jgi:DNA primase large subunit
MPRLLAKYPFLPAASERVDEEADLDELVADRAYGPARRMATERLVAAVEDAEVDLPEPATDADALNQLLSYAVARVMISVLEDDHVLRRHALAEAERSSRFLAREDPDVLLRAAGALDVPLEPVGGDEAGYELHFADYLRWATEIKNKEWKLINQPLEDGTIVLPQERAARLLEEAVKDHVEADLPLPVPEDLADPLEEHLEPVREAAEERRSAFGDVDEFGEVDMDAFPPCMQTIIDQLQSGEHVSHSGRFAACAFLSNVGMDADEIIEVFSKTPDFDEEIARYQIEHITGEGSASGEEYTTPNCGTMKTHGICYEPDKWCKHTRDDGTQSVTNPLSYYRWALNRKEWARQQDEDDPGPDDAPANDEEDGGDGGGGDAPDSPEGPGEEDEQVPESIRAQSGW